MTNTWRVMGMWDDGRQFLVVMGTSKADCRKRLGEALDDYTFADLEAMDSLWFEEWKQLPWEQAPRWEPTELISLRGYKLRKGRNAKPAELSPAPAAAALTLRMPPRRPALVEPTRLRPAIPASGW